jgi:hypothetical protein
MLIGTASAICTALRVTPEGMFDGVDWVLDPDSPGDGTWEIAPYTGPGAGAEPQVEREVAQ